MAGMLRVTPSELAALQRCTDRVRNICILAHVDHGKTTLSDSLVSANGIISERLAGKIRYLDNTEEEQKRGITMKSSAISLLYRPEVNEELVHANASGNGDASAAAPEPFLINLVDSPGHVDFSFDVSTAVRLCDGALVLVDAVEGVCAQTIAVIRQAWQEGIRPCLVINKMDRLILEIHLTPVEAWQRLNRILEQANAVLSSLIRAHVLAENEDKEDKAAGESKEEGESKVETEPSLEHAAMTDAIAQLEKELLFSPAVGNVLFASATDAWAFNIGLFARIFAKKLALPFRVVRQALWGEYFYNAKTKKIVSKPPTSSSRNLFCALILETIWTTYETLLQPVRSDDDLPALRKLTKQLRVSSLVSDRELKHGDRRMAIQTVMRKWLPLANAVLKMVTRALPNPIIAQHQRAEQLCGFNTSVNNKMPHGQMQVLDSIRRCNISVEAPVVVYICKMVSVEALALSDYAQHHLNRDDEVYVAMGRVYSGVLKQGAPIFVMDPKFQGLSDNVDEIDVSKIQHVTRIEAGQVRPYLMMGHDLHAVDEVPAGNIVGIVGLRELVLKTATLSSTLLCPPLTKMPFQAKPIVRVAVEPEDPRHFDELEAGLQRLYRSDPTVEVHVQETGEHVVVALGELHLERCLKDLKERFAKVAIRVSEPLVGYRETVVEDSAVPTPEQRLVFRDLLTASSRTSESNAELTKQEFAIAYGTTPDNSLTLRLRAVPLPAGLATFLEEHAEEIRQWIEARANESKETSEASAAAKETSKDHDTEPTGVPSEGKAVGNDESTTLASQMEALLRASPDSFWKNLSLSRLWNFGPRRIGPNILVNAIPWLPSSATTASIFNNDEEESQLSQLQQDSRVPALMELEHAIVTGFQMASAAGPLCDEPVWGVAFVLDDVEFQSMPGIESIEDDREATTHEDLPNSSTQPSNDTTSSNSTANPYGPLSGQVISTMRTICRAAVVRQPVRLVEAVYACHVQCFAEQLGKLYSVMGKRRAEIYNETLVDGSSLFTVEAYVPVIESFGLATELRIQTSGAASNPQLVFSHWVVLDEDPFFQPQTEQEREDLGERSYEHNNARKCIETVRKRKGLARDEKIVVHAEKQRTLARKR